MSIMQNREACNENGGASALLSNGYDVQGALGVAEATVPEQLSELEQARLTPVGFDMTYEGIVQVVVRRIPSGVYSAPELLQRVADSTTLQPQHLPRTLAPLLAHARLVALSPRTVHGRSWYVHTAPEAPEATTFEAVERLVGHLETNQAAPLEGLSIHECMQLGQSLGLVPEDQPQAAFFKHMLKSHDRLVWEQKGPKKAKLKKVLSHAAVALPATVGGAVDRLMITSRKQNAYDADDFITQAFEGRVLTAEARSAFLTVLAHDERFIQEPNPRNTADVRYRIFRPAPPAAAETTEVPAARLADIMLVARRVVKDIIDEDTISLTTDHLFSEVERRAGVDQLTAPEQRAVADHVRNKSRLEPVRTGGLFIERAVPPSRQPYHRAGKIFTLKNLSATNYERIRRIDVLLQQDAARRLKARERDPLA
jgi:hypothetical protein